MSLADDCRLFGLHFTHALLGRSSAEFTSHIRQPPAEIVSGLGNR